MITSSALSIYALVCAGLLFAGETLVVLRHKKYWPLSLDDYLVIAALVWASLMLEEPIAHYVMLAAFLFASGNLYAMLFTRMDPDGGSGERLIPLTIALLLSLAGGTMTLIYLAN